MLNDIMVPKLDDYKICHLVDLPSDSKFYIVQRQDSPEMLMKVLDKTTQPDPSLWLNERRALTQLKHKNIVELYNHYEDPDKVYFILEYIKGPDLHEMFFESTNSISEQEICEIFRQLAHGLKYIHDNHMAHGDIKLDNIVFNPLDNTIKIIDFGLSQSSIGQTLKKGGTEYYLAPETLRKIPHDIRTDDIWAAGVCLYGMLYRTFPFYVDIVGEDGLQKLWKKILNKRIDYIGQSCQLTILLENTIMRNHMRRYTIDKVLESSWLKN